MKDKKRYRSIFISDVHLGSKNARDDLLLEFLKQTDADNYFIIGDFIDGWLLQKRHYWTQTHNDILHFLFKKAKQDKNIVYVAGNHDEFIREFVGYDWGNIKVTNEYIHTNAKGNEYLLIHGDQFDIVTVNAKWLAYLGGWAYDWLVSLNKVLINILPKFNIHGFSLAAWVKGNIKEAVNFIGDYENSVAEYAFKKGAQGVICGHIHHAEDRFINISVDDKIINSNIHYLNTGDWVESCTAIVEHDNGKFEIVRKL